ncbi:unnamed protein product [Tetraodon nigroviridis]|uniref:(spotted green pufferfish) hypothetical protein n=1 Tax=Tetraodon nigroviridis TaxID=99883 RepID=Q4SQP3_TETNG|nr:unnamed protein product [Tetraodon nigroviridis]
MANANTREGRLPTLMRPLEGHLPQMKIPGCFRCRCSLEACPGFIVHFIYVFLFLRKYLLYLPMNSGLPCFSDGFC